MDEAEELGLPKATVVKVAAEFLPAGVKVNFSFGAAPACTCLLTSLLTLLAPCCAHATARSWCVHGHATEHANAMSGVCVCVCVVMTSAQLAAVASVTNYHHLQLMSQMSPDARDLIVQCCNGEPGAPGAQALCAASFHNTRTSRACSATRIVHAHLCVFDTQCVCAPHASTRELFRRTVARSTHSVFAHPTLRAHRTTWHHLPSQEFVQMVGSEAHTQSVAAKSGTIKPEHVFAALKDLEMGELVDKCKASATQPKFVVTCDWLPLP